MHVAYFDKTRGLACNFHQLGNPFRVLAKDTFKLSRRIPSMKMTGIDRKDVPEVSFKIGVHHLCFLI